MTTERCGTGPPYIERKLRARSGEGKVSEPVRAGFPRFFLLWCMRTSKLKGGLAKSDRKGGMWLARRVPDGELGSAVERGGDGRGDEGGVQTAEDEAVKQEGGVKQEEDGAKGVEIKQEPVEDV